MAATIQFGDRAPHRSAGAREDADALLLPVDELPAATGWELKPEGACLGDVCVPLAATARRPGLVDVAALARALGRPLVHEGGTWVVGEPAAAIGEALTSLEAPDVDLPDLDGRPHRLSDYRGRKVVLLSWASW